MNEIQKRKRNQFDRKEFGKHVKQARNQANLTSDQLGNDKCMVEPAFIRQIESGSKLPSMPIFVRICNSLQVSPAYLLENELQMKNIDSDWNELAQLSLQISPDFYQIIKDVLFSLIENLAEIKRENSSSNYNCFKENDEFEQIEFGRRLCKIREEMDFTPQQLAISCGISTAFIHEIEAGLKLPSLPVFTNLCNVLQVSPAYLLGNELKIFCTKPNLKELEQIPYSMTPKAQKITAEIIQILIQNFEKI